MKTKIAASVSGVLLIALLGLWLAEDEVPNDVVTDVAPRGSVQHERSEVPQAEPASEEPSLPGSSASRTRNASGSAAPSSAAESGAQRNRAQQDAGVQEISSTTLAERAINEDSVGDDQEEVEPDEFKRFKKDAAGLLEISSETRESANTEGMDPEVVDLLDLDGDGEVEFWELKRTEHLFERAEHHPRRNDADDGAYPVEREDYRRPDWEFDAADQDGDDIINEDEYYLFLVESERVAVFYDQDRDKNISYDESRLSREEFEPLDWNHDGKLTIGEVRRAVTLGAFPEPDPDE